MFGSITAFWGSADRMALFPFPVRINPTWSLPYTRVWIQRLYTLYIGVSVAVYNCHTYTFTFDDPNPQRLLVLVVNEACHRHGRDETASLSTSHEYQRYFSFKIHFRFSFYKFFCQSFLFLCYISIDLNNYFSFYNFYTNHFYFIVYQYCRKQTFQF